MAGQAVNEVLSRKANAARKEQEARVLSPARALRRALSRSADALWGLPIVVDGVQEETLVLDACLDGVPGDALVIVLEGPDGIAGAAVLDRATVRSVIEVQTIGRVTNLPPDPRALTPTDAAMCAPLLDAMMTRFSNNLDGHPSQGEFTGYRFGAMVEDTRALGILMDAAEFHSFLVSVELGDKMRRGELLFILPVVAPPEPDRAPEARGDPLRAKNAARMQMVEARLEAVLCRIRMSLASADQLKPGDLLPLPDAVLDQVELSAGGMQIAKRCRLGQMGGLRAVRLRLPAVAKADIPPAAEQSPPPPVEKKPAAAKPLALSEPTKKLPEDIPDLPEIPDIDGFSDLTAGIDDGLDLDDDLMNIG